MQPRPSCSADRNPVERLAEEFAERYRRGERPSLSEYVERCPEHAEEIRELFPALVVMERLKPAADQTGAYDAPAEAGGDRPPGQLGDYRLLREVGRGGMGVVYEAVQVSLGRHVALKVLPAHGLFNPTFLERFRREAQAAARLHHTNIVPVFGVGEAGGVHYYAMQFIQGEGLDRVLHDLRRLRRQPVGTAAAGTAVTERGEMIHSLLTGQFTAPAPLGQAFQPDTAPRQAGKPDLRPPTSGRSGGQSESAYYRGVARIGVQVAEALAYAHKQGIVHRDVKPSNLLLDSQGTVWVTDFGLAKAEDADELTRTGDIVGTVRYMAPERFEGRSLPQSDVYSLGLTLYEMLTLRPAFDERNRARLIEQVLRQSPPPPRRLDARIPRDLETVVLKCLAKDPAQRYATAEDLAEDLRRFLADRPIQARRAPWRERAWRWCRRNPGVAALTGAVFATLLAGTGFSTHFALRASSQARDARDEKGRADEEARQARAGRALAELHLYAADMNLAQMAWEKGWLKRVRQLLERYRVPPPGRADPRGWEWYYQQRLYQGERLSLPGHTGDVLAVAFSPDGRWLVSGSADRTVRLWDLTRAGEARVLTGHASPVWSVAVSPDGTRLASAGGNGLVIVWDAASGKQVRTFSVPPHGSVGVAFSPDGGLAVVSTDELPKGARAPRTSSKSVRAFDPVSGRQTHHFRWVDVGDNRDGAVGFSPDGRKLLAASDDYTVRVWDMASGKPLPPLRRREGVFSPVHSLAFSPDGVRVAVASAGGHVRVWDMPSGRLTHSLEAHEDFVRGVAFSPDGRWLASASQGGVVKLWDAVTGKVVHTLRAHPAEVHGIAFSPDGQRLATAGGDHLVKLWDVDDRQVTRIEKFFGGFVFSPDGRSLASYRASPLAEVFDVATGQRVHSFRGHDRTVTGVVFNPGGRRLSSGGEDGTVRVWDLTAGKGVRTLRGHRGPVTGVSRSWDGRWLASASRDGTVKVWDVLTGKVRHRLQGHAGPVTGVSFSPRGPVLASAGADRVIKLWDAEAGKELHALRGHAGVIHQLLFSPDGARLVSRDGPAVFRPDAEHAVKVWDVAGGRPLGTPGHSVLGLALSEDGRMLALGNVDGTIQLWHMKKGEIVQTLEGHAGWVHCVAFSPDGGRLASGSYDRSVRVWDLRTGQELRSLLGLENAVTQIAFTPDGQRLVAAASGSARLLIWDGRPPTAEVRDEREAVGLLDFLFSRPLTRDDVRALLRTHLTITDSVRQKALALADSYREESDPGRFNQASWAVARLPHSTPAVYHLARHQAETACRLRPGDPSAVNTLGVLQYRLGLYKEATATLRKSLAPHKGQADAFDLFFLAMCHARLGDADRAEDCFDRAVKWVEGQKDLPAGAREELKAFRAEAEDVLRAR